MIKKIKISKLPLVSSFTGLFTIGVDKDNKSVKIGLEFIKTAADNCDEKAKLADEKAAAADVPRLRQIKPPELPLMKPPMPG